MMIEGTSGALLVDTTSRTGSSNLVVAANTAVENPLSVVSTKVDQHQDMQSFFTEIQVPLSVVFKQQTPTYLSTPPQIIA